MHDGEAHARSIEEARHPLSDIDLDRGLTTDEAQERLREQGANELAAEERASPIALFVAQFKNTLIVILLVATVLSALLGEIVDAAIIAVIVLFCAVLSFVQEYRADNALKALKKMLAPTIRVLRDGAETRIPSRELVPGDIMLLEAGDRIPADARLVGDPLPQVRRSAAHGRVVSRREGIDAAAARRGRRRSPQRRLYRDHGDLWPRQGDRDEHGNEYGIRPDRRAGLRREQRRRHRSKSEPRKSVAGWG